MFLIEKKHPYYEHSTADFFIANRAGQMWPHSSSIKQSIQHIHRQASNFYLFDCEDDQEVANALFERAFDWAARKNLNRIVGPKDLARWMGMDFLSKDTSIAR